MARAAMLLCQKKATPRLYAHSQSRLIGFWDRLGFG